MRTMEPSHTSEDTFMTSLPPFTSMESQPEKTWFMIVKEEASLNVTTMTVSQTIFSYCCNNNDDDCNKDGDNVVMCC